jgi:uncharacterized repeat protein (TIGR01451 family)
MNRVLVSALVLLALLVGASPRAVAQQPMVELTKNCPNLRYLGRDATFEITVTNRGEGVAQNVVVTDVIPTGLDFMSVDKEGKRDGDHIVWQLGNLGAGESRVLKSTFRCNRIGKFKNSATVTYCARIGGECELEVKGIPAVLLECVDDPDPIEVNGNVTYTITVTNQGTAVGTNIAIACTLPDELEYVSSDGPTDAKSEHKKVVFKPLESLAPKAEAVFKVTVRGVDEGDVRFRVEMNTDQTDSPVMETESTHIYK